MKKIKNLFNKISFWTRQFLFKFYLISVAKIYRPKIIFNSSAPFLKKYSVIDDDSILELIGKICFTKKDARAGWFGAGLPKTNNNKKNYKNLANWATEHLYMYFAFMSSVKNGNKKNNILDVGCGIGFATQCLANIWPCSNFIGIDFDEDAISVASLFNNRSNITFLEKDFFEYNPEMNFNYIFALEVLEHIPANKHDLFIGQSLRMLTPGGKLFLSTPNALDEKDGTYSHIGLLNRKRARSFLKRYHNLIHEGFFIDNKMLITGDPKKFIVKRKITDFEKKGRNLSHFHIVMSKNNKRKN